MPPKRKHSEMIESVRTSQIMHVLALRMSGQCKTVIKACKQAGITPQVYYDWVEKYPDAPIIYRQMYSLEQRRILDAQVGTWLDLFQHLVKTALKSNRPTEIIATMDKLESMHPVLTITPDEQVQKAREYMRTMPKTRPMQSRLASLQLTPDHEGGLRVDVFKEQEVLDATFEDEDSSAG